MDKIALVVLCYNNWEITKKFIDLIYEHTDMDSFELLFIDNGSTDGSSKNLNKLEHELDNFHVIINDENKGVICGRNQGFRWFHKDTAFPYLMFLDNDQFVRDGWLGQHFAVLNKGYDLIGVEAWQMSRQHFPCKKNSSLKEWFSYVGCGGQLMTRRCVDIVGYYDERYNPCYFEDPDYSYRAFDQGLKIGWNFTAKIDHLPHQTLGKVGDKRGKFTKSMQKFQEKWKKRVPPMIYQVDLDEFKD
ncbi:MAG: glycosyltransferase [Candidatus Competibacteraceae bacterium]|nr:glycosyltransferase [Candidatus Competibacteraceae bacterium]